MSTERSKRLSQVNYWEELFKLRDEQRERQKTAVQVVKGSELPLENNKQGLMRWFLHPQIKDTVLSTFLFFEQVIPPGSRSGRIKCQGGQVMFILEGRGHTIIDGVKHSWAERDTLNLPLKRDGLIIQHVNDDPNNIARFLAAEPNWFECLGVDRGSGFEQIEPSPDYKG